MKNLFALICLIALMIIAVPVYAAPPLEVGWQDNDPANANAQPVFNVAITIPALDNTVSIQRSTSYSSFTYGQLTYPSYVYAAGSEVTGPIGGQRFNYTVDLSYYRV